MWFSLLRQKITKTDIDNQTFLCEVWFSSRQNTSSEFFLLLKSRFGCTSSDYSEYWALTLLRTRWGSHSSVWEWLVNTLVPSPTLSPCFPSSYKQTGRAMVGSLLTEKLTWVMKQYDEKSNIISDLFYFYASSFFCSFSFWYFVSSLRVCSFLPQGFLFYEKQTIHFEFLFASFKTSIKCYYLFKNIHKLKTNRIFKIWMFYLINSFE